MEQLIANESTKNLSMRDLRKVLPAYCTVKRYDLVRGKTLEQVMGSATVLILLWNIHDQKHRVLNQPGHFFVISTRGPEPCVVFSSTGMTPKRELFITQSNPKLLEQILPKGTVVNDVKLQVNKNSNTCWRWAILFAHLAPMGLKKFQELFRNPSLHISNSDSLATLLTLIQVY